MDRSMTQHAERKLAFSLPNLLTYGRIVAVPALVACYYIQGDLSNWLALGIFTAASITDFFDGYLARIWSQQSALGRMLDPIADKLLVASALLMLVANGVINGWLLWAALIIMSREMLVSGLREYLAEVEVSVPVTRIAKWKTAMQMVAIGFLLSVPAGEKLIPGVTLLGYGLLWLSAAMTLYTGYDYLRAGITHVLGDG
ncbi:MAG: CDP-diacylglycerol--glycerol-3-phosphate 3-phosphatidyltransferase [Hyphomicrobiales bacterium]|nr:MAG: CDP-diacylglycerol--glycerol-3-phosphate 3-phosphatidyltransferase [Hyphomicrobiales bacterium]